MFRSSWSAVLYVPAGSGCDPRHSFDVIQILTCFLPSTSSAVPEVVTLSNVSVPPGPERGR